MGGSGDLPKVVNGAAERIIRYRGAVGAAPVFPEHPPEAVRAALGGPMPDGPSDAAAVVDRLADAIEPGLVASTGPRYFGFVIGGSTPGALGADLLTAGWDQNGFNAVTSPMAAVIEDIAGEWLKDVLMLPATASFGFATGAQGANTAGLAAARHHVLAQAGWDVEHHGLAGAPKIRVIVGAERHATIDRTVRLLGLGLDAVQEVPADANGAIELGALRSAVAEVDGPLIVVSQAGNVNSGACDDLTAVCDIAHDGGRAHRAWVHVDGAFGLWAAASPTHRSLVEGLAQADSWACDGHKWLNVPYDSGYVFCAHPAAHQAAMAYSAAYLIGQGGDARSPSDYVLESSRRARGFATWAALAELGRTGIADVVDRACALAQRFATQLAAEPGMHVANEVVLNQVLVGFGADDRTDHVIDLVQRSGECWMGATTWHGQRLMRISVSNATTTEADVDRSVAAIRAAHAAA